MYWESREKLKWQRAFCRRRCCKYYDTRGLQHITNIIVGILYRLNERPRGKIKA